MLKSKDWNKDPKSYDNDNFSKSKEYFVPMLVLNVFSQVKQKPLCLFSFLHHDETSAKYTTKKSLIQMYLHLYISFVTWC